MTTRPPLSRWLEAIDAYRDRRVIAILFMGFSSGLPLALSAWTLGIWLRELRIDLTTIGIFALVGIAYSFKFVWAPIIDQAPLPGLTRWLGQRRGWALVTQVGLIVALLGLGGSDPAGAPAVTAMWAVLLAFCSASQDIVIDAFRIELLDKDEQALGAVATQYGYRGGLIVSGAGALFAAEYGGWPFAYTVMAGFVLVGVVTVLLTREPKRAADRETVDVRQWVQHAVVDPFADFMRRQHWAMILLFMLLYKVGDAVAGVMAGPFYIDMGFSKIEIAEVSKIFGVIATYVGIFIGGVLVYRLGMMKALLLCGVLQMLSNLMYAAQAVVGHDVGFLMLTIGIENLTGGMGSAAFVAYLSALCNVPFTATQYALYSSLTAVPRTILASSGGYFAETLGWVPFFLFSTVAAAPGLLVLLWLMRREVAPRRPDP